MTENYRKFLSSIFTKAWTLRRADPTCSFGRCLKAAWAYMRELAAVARKFVERAKRNGGHLRFSPSLIRSPIQRSLTGTAYGSVLDHKAAYLTSRLGG